MQPISRITDNAMPPIEVTATLKQWEQLARQCFGWRTLAGYTSWQKRIQSLGSSDYDKLIRFASERI